MRVSLNQEYNVGPCSRTHDLKCSNTTQGVADPQLGFGGVGPDDVAFLKYLHTF